MGVNRIIISRRLKIYLIIHKPQQGEMSKIAYLENPYFKGVKLSEL